jgi:glycosyltransferase involved in cell wall biosynthesis
MRVGLIAPPWISVPPSYYGGTEDVVDTLARGLSEAGHDVVLVTTGDSTCPVARRSVYPRGQIGELGNVAFELRHLLYAYETLGDVDIVHDHTVAGPLLARRFAVEHVVTTNHGPFTAEANAIYAAAGDVPVIAISHHHASTAQVPVAKVIPHGIDLERYPFGSGSGGYLVFLGRMSPNKGVVEAIAIARRVGLPLVIAAKLQERCEHDYYEAEVAPRLGDGICYIGTVGRGAKARLLGQASALLNPIAWDEPFGLCMVEAMACGTPVIVTPRGSAPEIVTDGVTGFVRDTVDELVAATREIATIDRDSCRAAVEARFTAARMVADYVTFYEQITSDGGGKAVAPFNRVDTAA